MIATVVGDEEEEGATNDKSKDLLMKHHLLRMKERTDL